MLALAVAALLTNGSVATIDPLTLRPRGDSVPLVANPWAHAWSPDHRFVAFTVGARHTRIQVVDMATKRTTAVISISHKTWFPWLTWTRSGRLLAVGFDGTVVSADPAGRVVARSHVPGRTVFDDVVTAGDGAVMLRTAGGRAALYEVAANATIRRITLPNIRARSTDNQLAPGLAADATTAYVASATRNEIVTVDLASGAATRHPLAAGDDAGGAAGDAVGAGRDAIGAARGAVAAAAVGARRDAIGAAPRDRVARAAKDDVGAYRQLALTAPGVLALAGYDELRGIRRRVLGLRFVDTRTWTVRMAAPRAPYFQPSPAGVLVGEVPKAGVTAFGANGNRLFARLAGRDVAVGATGPYVYARTLLPHHRTRVLDATTGRTLNVLPTAILPRLL